MQHELVFRDSPGLTSETAIHHNDDEVFLKVHSLFFLVILSVSGFCW